MLSVDGRPLGAVSGLIEAIRRMRSILRQLLDSLTRRPTPLSRGQRSPPGGLSGRLGLSLPLVAATIHNLHSGKAQRL